MTTPISKLPAGIPGVDAIAGTRKSFREFVIPVLLAIGLAACGTPPAAPPPPPVKVKPADESSKFPAQDRIKVEIAEEHVLGKAKLPAGNEATYQAKGRQWQLFLIKAKSNEAAALLLFDYQGALADVKFVAHFGGYSGEDGGTPMFLFQKGPYLAGVAGLPEKDADALARLLAARLSDR